MARVATSKPVPRKLPTVKYKAGAVGKEASGPLVPVFVDGELAMNRHYLISKEMAEVAAVKAKTAGWSLAEVLRLGLDEYVQGVHKPAGRKPKKAPLVVLPEQGLEVLARAWKSGKSERQNQTLAAFHQAGWPLRTLAEALVASGAAKTMTRQAISLRVLAAGKDVPRVRGVFAPSGPRRSLAVAETTPRVELKDVGVRVSNRVYELAKVRARNEGAQMSALIEDILVRFVKGKFKMPEHEPTIPVVPAVRVKPVKLQAVK
ncbi:hypothetical protein [Tessaracoccus sp.]